MSQVCVALAVSQRRVPHWLHGAVPVRSLAMSAAGSADGSVRTESSKPAGTAKGRSRAAKTIARPKIDLDKEIQEANLLATMSRKLMTAARAIERNNKKSKTRLIRKAGKLSPEDLERLAVLKRCGLYAEAVPEEPEGDAEAANAESSSSQGLGQRSGLGPKKQKLADLLEGNPSAQAFLDGVRGAFPSLTTAGTGRIMESTVSSEQSAGQSGEAASSAHVGGADVVE